MPERSHTVTVNASITLFPQVADQSPKEIKQLSRNAGIPAIARRPLRRSSKRIHRSAGHVARRADVVVRPAGPGAAQAADFVHLFTNDVW
jgi:hypothetical protein